tara:strand:+ start:911 stop:1303 length:393 start_codon:yes stop_codon:yes gene_type:complete
MKLPKLYRVCWVSLYWLTDTCEGGEHVQRDGTFKLKARRVLRTDKSWFWQIDEWDRDCGDVKYHLQFIDDLPPEEQFESWEYKNPYPFNERDNFGPVTNRPPIKPLPTIVKKPKDRRELNSKHDFDDSPF